MQCPVGTCEIFPWPRSKSPVPKAITATPRSPSLPHSPASWRPGCERCRLDVLTLKPARARGDRPRPLQLCPSHPGVAARDKGLELWRLGSNHGCSTSVVGDVGGQGLQADLSEPHFHHLQNGCNTGIGLSPRTVGKTRWDEAEHSAVILASDAPCLIFLLLLLPGTTDQLPHTWIYYDAVLGVRRLMPVSLG